MQDDKKSYKGFAVSGCRFSVSGLRLAVSGCRLAVPPNTDNRIPITTQHRTPNTEHRGFTLIEMMVVMAIFTIMMGIAFTAIRLNETYRDLTFIRIQLYRQNKRSHDAIREELEKSNSSRVNITDNTSPTPDAIRFQIPLINATTYNISWGARYNDTDYVDHYIYYSLNSTNLVRDVLNSDFSKEIGTQEIKATNIIYLQFSNTTANYINMNTTARKATLSPSRNITDSMNSTVYLLN